MMMNKIRYSIICVLYIILVACEKSTDKYQSVLNKGVFTLADPYILEDNGTFYMYGTLSRSGIIVCKSNNLRDWSDCCGNAQFNLALYREDVWGEYNFWAPEVYKVGNKYVMTYTSEKHICYAESDSPCGPFVQRTKSPYLIDEEGIDSSFFFDDSGHAYLCWDRHSAQGGVYMAQMSDDLQSIQTETATWVLDVSYKSWENRDGWICEAPQVIKKNDAYYLIYSCNSYESQDYAVGYAVSNNPMGPYKKYSNNPILHKHGGYFGTGHASLLCSSKGDYIVYHAHHSEDVVEPRMTLISPIEFVLNERGEYVIQVSDEIIIPKVAETN